MKKKNVFLQTFFYDFLKIQVTKNIRHFRKSIVSDESDEC